MECNKQSVSSGDSHLASGAGRPGLGLFNPCLYTTVDSGVASRTLYFTVINDPSVLNAVPVILRVLLDHRASCEGGMVSARSKMHATPENAYLRWPGSTTTQSSLHRTKSCRSRCLPKH